MAIRRLDPLLIDRIAAGEVIERPAAAVKELVENALDAGATRVDVALEEGGRRLIRVTDDGLGMGPDDLQLAIERHATSKLPTGDLEAIATLGFRGEALPSIASVSRMEVRSRARGADAAWRLVVDQGARSAVEPVAHPHGTQIDVRDLFAATPARLKFLKTDQAEKLAAIDALRRLALARADVRFTLTSDGTRVFDWPAGAVARRLADALGEEFMGNALAIDATRGDLRLTGFIARATFNKPNANAQFAFVNGRSVRDKLVAGALRAGYLDTIPRGRHPAAALYLTCPPRDVDVNVHPAKTEVRFRDGAAVRSLIVGTLQRALAVAPVGASAPRPSFAPVANWEWRLSPAASVASQTSLAFADAPQASHVAEAPAAHEDRAAPLGAARAQLHDTYIVAGTPDGFVLVDQHAAHERIVYEKLKRQRAEAGIERQLLLTPLVVDLAPDAALALLAHADELAALGLGIESFGPGAVLVREAPALVASGDLTGLMRDLADDALADNGAQSLERKLDHRLATIACHHSVRAGRALKPAEMNALLREMERTPNAGQCNHGRPTFVTLTLAEVERMFERR